MGDNPLYLYGHEVTVFTDHSAVKAVLETPHPTGKHDRWWTKVYGSGVKTVRIQYRPGRLNSSVDALSRSPQAPSPASGVGEDGSQVAIVSVEATDNHLDVQMLLEAEPIPSCAVNFGVEQRKDPDLQEIVDFLEEELSYEQKWAWKIALQASLFTIEEGILYYVDPKQKYHRRVVVPHQLREQILREGHSSGIAGHFSGKRTYGALAH